MLLDGYFLLVYWEVDDVLLQEPFLCKEVGDGRDLYNLMKRLQLLIEVAAFERDDTVGQGVVLLFGNILSHDLHHIGERHDRPGDDEIELVFLVLAATVHGFYVLQPDGFCYGNPPPHPKSRMRVPGRK